MGDYRSRSGRGERRVITALFCDVVGSTSMAEGLDPEEWADIMNEAFEVLTAPVSRYEGSIARLMGDGLLAFFGAPVAHEDDPERAVLAGLDILEAVKPLRERLRLEYGLEFAVRVGINTGPVVVGDVGSSAVTEYTAMGDAVNIAARMEQTAEPGTVRVSAETWRLVERTFESESLGAIEVKGKTEPVPAYRVIGVKDQPVQAWGFTELEATLIGRDRELGQLMDILAQVRAGRGQIVSLIGEAGLGKSRLIDEFHRCWVEGSTGGDWEYAVGVPYDASRPYSLFQKLARGTFDIRLDDPPETIHRKVEGVLRAGGASDEAVALCSVTMERVIAAKVLHDAPEFPAEAIKKDLYEVAYPAWMSSAETTPTVAVFDDLQWADQASIDLLIHLLGATEEAPVLFFCAFRPERQSPAWRFKQIAEANFPHRYTEIVLEPLDERDTDRLVSELLHITDLPSELHALILRKTEGNPYFVEEVVHTLIEQGVIRQDSDALVWDTSTEVSDIRIPDSIQALLMARIDRLDRQAKETLQLASVIGRSFYHKILQAISDSTRELGRHLASLERVDIIREQERIPELEYVFKHELARDAAYHSMLRRRRREVHRRVAVAMETIFEGKLEENAHRLAYHFEEGGDDERAMSYFEMAAEAAEGLHARSEAVGHFERALAAARRLGAPETRLRELGARLEQVAA